MADNMLISLVQDYALVGLDHAGHHLPEDVGVGPGDPTNLSKVTQVQPRLAVDNCPSFTIYKEGSLQPSVKFVITQEVERNLFIQLSISLNE